MRLVTSAAIHSSFILTILAVAVLGAASTQTFTGTITDSICANADHSRMRMGPDDAACTLACVVAHGATFVLYDGKNTTYTLSDQKSPREFAGRRVKVKGTLDVNMIQVESITDANLDSLMAAYIAVAAIFFGYAFTIARRVAHVQADIARLKS
jgi:hypothetical protein